MLNSVSERYNFRHQVLIMYYNSSNPNVNHNPPSSRKGRLYAFLGLITST
jgi:hypothetical protein